MTRPNPILRLRGLSKRFGALQALCDVSLELRAGQVHALLGENGAGKSTLMSIVAGLLQADSGDMQLDGARYDPRKPRQASDAGVGMVHQHFMLVPQLCAADNILLGDRGQGALLKKKALRAKIKRLTQRHGFEIDLDCPVQRLPVAEQQQVEILKVLWRGARVIIFDEPSAVLGRQQVQSLYTTLRALARDGAAVVVITHRLSEVLRHADRVTVLRKGRLVASDLAVAGCTRRELSTMLISSEMPQQNQPLPTVDPRDPIVLDLDGLRGDDIQCGQLGPLDLKVRAGEILAVAGVSGNGQRALVELLMGLRRPQRGRIVLDGHEIQRMDLRARRQRGLGLIPADRLAQGVAASRSVLSNLSVYAVMNQPSPWIRDADLRLRAERLIRKHDIALSSLDQAAGELSGGNLQKLIVARELAARPRLLIADQPYRGLDMGAAAAVKAELLALSRAGGAVLLISQDLDELLAIASRMVVLYRGRVVAELSRAEFDLSKIAALMLSGDDARAA